MSGTNGYEDEMGIEDHGLSIEEADQLLAGVIPAGRNDLSVLATNLGSLSAAFHHEVDPVELRKWAGQAAANAGLTPSDKGDLAATPASNANRPAPQASGLPKRRISVLSSLAAFLGTSIGKSVAAGALVAASATGGLAATGNLPGQSDDDATITVVDSSTSEVEDDIEADDSDDSPDDVSDDVADTDEDSDDDADETEACEVEDDADHDDDAEDDSDDDAEDDSDHDDDSDCDDDSDESTEVDDDADDDDDDDDDDDEDADHDDDDSDDEDSEDESDED